MNSLSHAHPRISALGLALALSLFGFVFSASFAHAASSIIIDTLPPSECQLAGNFSIGGTAIADAPPGQLEQYHIQIDWGDGATTNQAELNSFGSGHGESDPVAFSGSHTYTTPGTYTIKARIYHTQPPGNDNQADQVDSIEVCIVVPLTINKTATTTFNRIYGWSIDKTAATSSLLLADGETYNVNYNVAVNATSTDSNWAVGGMISVTNPAGNPSITVTVTDTLSAFGSVTGVSCPSNTIVAGATLVCTYYQPLGSATDQTNKAEVYVTGKPTLNGTSTPVSVTFGAPTNLTDECITVTDTDKGTLGTACAGTDTLPKNFSYALTFGKTSTIVNVLLVCGPNTHNNTATMTTNDRSITHDDVWSVAATVACNPGCTLTQGYWKTHNASFKDGAPLDDAWNLLGAQKEQTPFFLSDTTWFNVFWTAPAGNVYYQLAHQYMTAKLNQLNGAIMPAPVLSAFDTATGLLSSVAPATAATYKGSTKNTWTNLAGILANFNEGKAGVAHCSEQNQS
jgi:hypothetical protein